MNTEHMVNYSYDTIHEFYCQGIVSQAQWEAYDFIWASTHPAEMPYYWSSLPQDARIELWRLYAVCPDSVKKDIRRKTIF